MSDKLAVIVLGNRHAGKSHTWNTLFDQTVRTGTELRWLFLTKREYVEVFLVSGSPEERHEYVGDLIAVKNPRIVLCSLQYRDDVMQSFDYFAEMGYFQFIHWLNPGYNDDCSLADSLGVVPRLLERHTVLGQRDGKIDAWRRVSEMRDLIYGWAKARNLIRTAE